MRMHTPLMGIVEGVEYRSYLNKSGVKINDVLRVTFEGPYGNEYTHDLDNGPFRFENPSLQFMAHCGAAPSRVEECVGASITLCRGPTDDIGEYGYFLIDEQTLRSGRIALKSADWFPDERCPSDEDDDDESEEQETAIQVRGQ
jgi:hypothetical protein